MKREDIEVGSTYRGKSLSTQRKFPGKAVNDRTVLDLYIEPRWKNISFVQYSVKMAGGSIDKYACTLTSFASWAVALVEAEP